MIKFVILFHNPADPSSFEDAYNDFLALVERMPHIQRRQVNSILGSPLGETTLYRALEVYFDDNAQMSEALNSPPGQAAGSIIMSRFPAGSFEFYFAEVYEEAGAQTPQPPTHTENGG